MEPRLKRRRRLVKDRSGSWMDMMTAVIAGVRRATGNAVMHRDLLAEFAVNAIRVKVLAEPFQA